jgi:hypothetical protein
MHGGDYRSMVQHTLVILCCCASWLMSAESRCCDRLSTTQGGWIEHNGVCCQLSGWLASQLHMLHSLCCSALQGVTCSACCISPYAA